MSEHRYTQFGFHETTIIIIIIIQPGANERTDIVEPLGLCPFEGFTILMGKLFFFFRNFSRRLYYTTARVIETEEEEEEEK